MQHIGKSQAPESHPIYIDKDERTALKTLRQDETITILPADKGNATVVMDTEEYKQKVKSLLE